MTVSVNIASHLPDMARRQPNEPAVIVQKKRPLSDGFDYDRLSFAQLNEASDRAAIALESLGVANGERTVLMVKPSLEFFALVFALFKTGAVPVLVDPGMGIRNLKACLAEAAPSVFIGIPKAHAARVLLGWARESLRVHVTVGHRLFWGGPTLDALLRAVELPPEGYAMASPDPEKTAAILFTSGSTGVPKGVVYTHRIFSDQVDCLRELYDIEPGERDLATFPLFALFGPALGMAAIVPDMDATRPARANPRHIAAAARDWSATNMFASPALLARLGEWGVRHKEKIPTLKRVISAGAPADPETLRRFLKITAPGVEIFTPYGATESLPVCSIGSRELLRDTARQTERGAGVCVGRPAPRAKIDVIQITDEPIAAWNDNLRVAPGEIGEIVVQGPRVTREYFNRPKQTALAKIPDLADGGFYHRMGDVGYFDDEGRLWFCGRKSHRVLTPERTLFTIPCERIFNTHAQVARTALVGVGERGKSRPVLCVELLRDGAWSRVAIKQLRRELLALGAKHAKTQDIQTILIHPGFPVDIRHNAKIFREKLAVWAAERLKCKRS